MNEEQNDFREDEQTEEEAQTCCDSMDASCSLEAFFNPSLFDSQATILEQLYTDDVQEQYLSLLFAQNYFQPNSAQNHSNKPSMLQFDFNDLEKSMECNEKPKSSLNFGQFYLQNLQFQKTQQAKQEEKREIQEKQHLNQAKGTKDEMKLTKCELNTDSILKQRLNEIGNSNHKINSLSVSALSINPVKGNYMGHMKVQSMDSTSRNNSIWSNTAKPSQEYLNGKQSQNQSQQTKKWKVLEGQWRGHRENRKRTPKSNDYYSQSQLTTPEAFTSNLSLLLEDPQSQYNQKSILGLPSPANLQINVVTSPQQQRFLFSSKSKQIDQQLRTGVPQKSIRGVVNSPSPLSQSQSSLQGPSSSSLFNIKGIMKESIETVSKLRFQLIDSCRSTKSNISANDHAKIIKNVQTSTTGANKDAGLFSDFQMELAGEQNESHLNNLSQSNIVFFKAPQFISRESLINNNIHDNSMRFHALLQKQRQQQNQRSQDEEIKQLQNQQAPIVRNLRTRKSAAFERIFSSHMGNIRNAAGYDHAPSSTQSARMKNNYQVQEQDKQLPFKDSIARRVKNLRVEETGTTADSEFFENFQGKKGHFKKISVLHQPSI